LVDELDATQFDFLCVLAKWGANDGSSTTDGASDYECVTTALDAGPLGSRGAFRIKILTAGDPDDVVIDNQPGDSDIAFLTTEATSGNIVVR